VAENFGRARGKRICEAARDPYSTVSEHFWITWIDLFLSILILLWVGDFSDSVAGREFGLVLCGSCVVAAGLLNGMLGVESG
jgi:hypothetical protein